MAWSLRRGRRCRAFSLIELLVAIAIIALLVALTLPAIAKSREAARTVVCTSNMRQVVLGFSSYAADYRVIPGGYWQGPLNLDWCGRQNATYISNPGNFKQPFQTSVLYEYLSEADKVLECPSARREANKFFDYTMVIRFAGARTDLGWQVTYPQSPGTPGSVIKVFPAIPLLIEESEQFFNRTVNDGSFAGGDQFSTRHGARASGSAAGNRGGACNVGYLDGSVGLFKSPTGGRPDVEEIHDLTATHLRVVKGGGVSHQVSVSTAAEFGWVNAAR